jgi:shikimate dehydrogenase
VLGRDFSGQSAVGNDQAALTGNAVIVAMDDRYVVLGNPIAQSRSPAIHALFAAQTEQGLTYTAQLASIDGFASVIKRLCAEGVRGANVTAPFKEEAFALATRRSASANAAGAANMLTFQGDDLLADNTDGVGLVRDLTINLGLRLSGCRILLLGAGGAARGVLNPLLAEQPACLVVANRTEAKAAELVARCGVGPVEAASLAALTDRQFDLVINATSAALHNGVSPAPTGVFAQGALAYDMVYGRDTDFMKHAERSKARVADGLGMLVEQAAESFFLWRGLRPDTAPVLAAMRDQIKHERVLGLLAK